MHLNHRVIHDDDYLGSLEARALDAVAEGPERVRLPRARPVGGRSRRWRRSGRTRAVGSRPRVERAGRARAHDNGEWPMGGRWPISRGRKEEDTCAPRETPARSSSFARLCVCTCRARIIPVY